MLLKAAKTNDFRITYFIQKQGGGFNYFVIFAPILGEDFHPYSAYFVNMA